MLLVLHACMAGVYPGATARATVPVKLLLYRHYVTAPISPEHLATWVQQNNHILLFVAIKEYIAYAVSTVPGLSNVLDSAYMWHEFVQSATLQSDIIRKTINQYSATPSVMFGRALAAVLPIRSYKCRTPVLEQGNICEALQAAVRLAYHPSVDVYRRPLRMAIYHEIRDAVALGAPVYDVAVAMGISPDIASKISRAGSPAATANDWRAVRSIRCNTVNEALVLHEFAHAWTMCYKIITHRLPQHIIDEQAMARTGADRTIYACACCKQLRAFVVDESSNGNAWACGHQKVLLDDITGVVYCGKRIEKNSVPNRASGTESSRSYWKAQQSLMCGYSPLLRIDMDGTLLNFYGKLYMLCPGCICVMRLHAGRYHGGSIQCVNCSYRAATPSGTRCFHCYTSSANLKTVALTQGTVHVCPGCWRRWMTLNDVTNNIDKDTAHLAINERWSTNRVAVYCACI